MPKKVMSYVYRERKEGRGEFWHHTVVAESEEKADLLAEAAGWDFEGPWDSRKNKNEYTWKNYHNPHTPDNLIVFLDCDISDLERSLDESSEDFLFT